MTGFDLADFSYSRKRAPAVATLQSRQFTIRVRGQTIGLPVDCVKTIFHVENLTPVPLAPREVAGLANLRGRIVTALHLDRCLWLGESGPGVNNDGLAVGIEHNGEEYALLVDETDDVVVTDESDRISCPAHIDPRLAELMAGCYRHNGGFLSILDIGAVLRRVSKLSEATLREGRSTNTNRGASS
ncbi:chemotaxis protein CheW [Methylocystis sp. WRRC1]|uniref:chemotaxis protein CheW n=1 Tax=Methylocystis sp. WRRC1 TaxID=1732014 RepID=UPI001D13F633|nr:chemotaxis protein CheW [Methylocystis sp. WRRC1]